MEVTLLAFAQARDQLGWTEQRIECEHGDTPRAVLCRVAPQLDVAGLRVARDGEYHGWDEPIGVATELALIPPVSGG